MFLILIEERSVCQDIYSGVILFHFEYLGGDFWFSWIFSCISFFISLDFSLGFCEYRFLCGHFRWLFLEFLRYLVYHERKEKNNRIWADRFLIIHWTNFFFISTSKIVCFVCRETVSFLKYMWGGILKPIIRFTRNWIRRSQFGEKSWRVTKIF